MPLICSGGCGSERGLNLLKNWVSVKIAGIDPARERSFGPEERRFCPPCWARVDRAMHGLTLGEIEAADAKETPP